ncbi:MAG: TMEM175 family protein [Flavobacteriales bacterium]
MLKLKFTGPEEKIRVGSGRLETLGDGVFAIVMTLLVLELRIPEWEGEVTNAQVWDYMKHLAPSFFSFGLSFAILGIMWFAHRMEHIFIGAVNRKLIWLNMLFYGFICLVPFSAAMLGRYPNVQLVILLYGANLIFAIAFLYWIWSYGTSLPDLREREVPAELRRVINVLFALAPTLYIVAILLSFIEPVWGFYCYLLTPLLYFVPTPIDKYLPAKSNGTGSVTNR